MPDSPRPWPPTPGPTAPTEALDPAAQPDPAEPAAPADPADRPLPPVPENRLVPGPAADVGGLLGELAIAAARIGTFDWNLSSGRITWDEHFTELVGEAPNIPLAQSADTFLARIHPDDKAAVVDAIQTAIASGGELDAEYRLVLRGGEIRWITARGRVLRDRDGEPVRLLGAAYDSTERQEVEARTGRVLESMPTAFFSLSRDWRFTYVNAAAERLLGRDRGALLGGDLWELFPEAPGSAFETHYRGAMRTGEPVAFDAYYPPPLDAWFEVRAWPGPDGLAVYFVDVTARRRTQEEVEQAVRSAALMAQVTAELTETFDAEEAVGRLAHLVVPVLADWCIVTLVDDEAHPGRGHGLRDIGWAHTHTQALPKVEEYAQHRLTALSENSLLARALRTGEPVVLQQDAARTIHGMLTSAEAQRLVRELGPEGVTVLPLRGRGGTVGLMSLFHGPDRAPLTPAELTVAREVAGRAGLALDNSRLYRRQRQLAEGLQRALLTEPPRTAGLQITVRYEPAGEAAQVGGDWYDAFVQPDGATVLVIGDVVGHDVAAAAEMGQLRSLLRGIAVATGAGPAELLHEVDEAMLTLQSGTIATAVVARVEGRGEGERGRRVRWSNAGHPPPMLIRADGTVTEVTGVRTDLLLGVVPDTTRTDSDLVVDEGATLFLYTDGLVERRDQSLSRGLAALRDTLADVAHRDLGELCDAVLRRMAPRHRSDDVALVAVRVGPPGGLPAG